MIDWDEKHSDLAYWWTVTVIAILGILLCFTGCGPHPSIPTLPADSATIPQVLIKTVIQTNWLVTIGLLVMAFGVFAFANGQTKAIGLMAAGIALVGGVVFLGVITDLIIGWTPLLGWILPVLALTALGLWSYNHCRRSKEIKSYEARLRYLKNIVDVNKDGVVNVEDIKLMLKDVK